MRNLHANKLINTTACTATLLLALSSGAFAQSLPIPVLGDILSVGSIQSAGLGNGLAMGDSPINIQQLMSVGENYLSQESLGAASSNLTALSSAGLANPDAVLSPVLSLLTGLGIEFFPVIDVLMNDPATLPDYIQNGGQLVPNSIAVIPIPQF